MGTFARWSAKRRPDGEDIALGALQALRDELYTLWCALNTDGGYDDDLLEPMVYRLHLRARAGAELATRCAHADRVDEERARLEAAEHARAENAHVETEAPPARRSLRA